MAVDMGTLVYGAVQALRVHRVDKWISAAVGGNVIVRSKAARLVWEPRRVVPSYAVPRADIVGVLEPFTGDVGVEKPVRLGDGPSVLDPSTPFSIHTCPGQALTINSEVGSLAAAAFVPEDRDLAGYVVLDWAAFDQWYEEAEPVMGHPHDPFDRIDCLRSSRHVVVSLHGQVLADTTRATVLFETPLPLRYYLPPADVRLDLLEPSGQRSVCAYKGVASYLSATVQGRHEPDVAWSYPEPLHDAVPVRDLISFFTERVDLAVDGQPIPRPVTPWS